MSERKQLCVNTHSANGKVFYVGQGTRLRPRKRDSRSHAWKDHVKAARGSYEVNIVHWTNDRDEAVRIESELIAAHPSACNVEKYDKRAFPKSVGIVTEIRPSPELIEAIDDWRRHQPDLPPRAEAIVRLVTIGLETVAKKKAKQEPKK